MPKTSPTYSNPRSFMRSIAVGDTGVVSVEVTLLQLATGLGVVLREARVSPALPQDCRLATAFEGVCTVLRWELKCCQGLSSELRFFQRTYEMRPTGVVRWQVRESVPQSHGLRWVHPDSAALQSLQAALG